MSFEYYPRLADDELRRGLQRSGAVVIRGAKWCGKTETAIQQARSIIFLQDPDEYENNLLTAQTKPSLLLAGDQPRLIDEWQDFPQVWDAVRFAIDRQHKRGCFILTGSVSREMDANEKPKHSGVGRIASMTMRPMSLFESRESSGEVSLGALFEGAKDVAGTSSWDIEDVARQVCRGGWPEAVAAGEETAGDLARDYLDAVAERDVSLPDGVRRDPTLVRLIMAAYARCTATQASGTTIRGHVNASREDISRNTASAYIGSLRRLYLFEDLPSWRPSLRDKARITATPKRHFVDPSLAAAALGATPQNLLHDLPTLGQLFESLVVRDLRIYAQAIGGKLHHYHDGAGREADAVITMPDGRWALVEVKLGGKGVADGANALAGLAKTIDQTIMGSPSFLAVVHAGRFASHLANGVLALPLGCLKQ
ncbi:MAG: ATP-binding protein [Atopobiaceae bacterium]|nr:ATP-binding protein [Atopobiaceae bacterium]